MTDEFPVRKLIVTGQTLLATLKSGSSLYECFATDEHGKVVDQPFRSFVEIEPGKVADYEVRPYDDKERGIRTFTLIPKERESRTAKLVKQVQALEERINDLENTLDSRVASIVEEHLDDVARKDVF